ncbi:MAG: hypothetical protein H0U70_02480 [Tatlockia sp.]|nr:hypothetical protein [Tatlockia sp.]
MDKKALEQFIADFYQAWKNRDEEKIPTFYDKNLRAYSDFSEVSLEDILNRLEFSKNKFAEVNYHIEDQFIDEAEGKIAIRMKQRHILKTGEPVKWESIMLYKIVNYKITDLWMSFYPNADYLNNDQF